MILQAQETRVVVRSAFGSALVRHRAHLSGGLVGALLLIEIIAVRHYLAHGVRSLLHADPGWVLVAVALELVSMNAFARTQRRMLRAGGTRVSLRRMVSLAYEANALNVTLPGGTAISSAYLLRTLRGWGVGTHRAGFMIVASWALSSATFLGLVISCGLIADRGSWVLLAALVGAALAIPCLTRWRRGWIRPVGRFARAVLQRANTMRRRDPQAGLARVQELLGDLRRIRPTTTDWLVGIAFAALNWLADLGALAASCRAVGVEHLSLTLILTCYIAGMTASSLSLLPGGFGVIDLAMIIALRGGGVAAVPATAGVIVYRLISCLMLALFGWLAYLVQRRHRSAPAAGGCSVDAAPAAGKIAQTGRNTQEQFATVRS